MKKALLSLGFGLAAAFSFAQTSYDFSYKTGQPYTPLSTGTDIAAGVPWVPGPSRTMPVGFAVRIGDSTVSKYIIESDVYMPSSGTKEPFNSFMPLGANLVDRGKPTGIHLSPIRYLTEGSSPDRIFKMEYWNAGFLNEYNDTKTTNDSINFQVWLYETSNIVEFHYGSRNITGTGNFFLGANALVTYTEENIPSIGAYTRCYNLKGDPDMPVMDSSYGGGITSILGGVPPAGSVYRFTPRVSGTGIEQKTLLTRFKVYPTLSTGLLYLDNTATLTGTVTVIAASGQEVMQEQKMLPGINQFHIEQLPAALYLLRVRTAEGTQSYRFTKK